MRGLTSPRVLAVVLLLFGTACERAPEQGASQGAPAPAAAPALPPKREPLVGGPFPSLFLTVAQFTDVKKPDGKVQPVPGAAKLQIVRKTDAGWKVVTVEDPDSNAFHKAMP